MDNLYIPEQYYHRKTSAYISQTILTTQHIYTTIPAHERWIQLSPKQKTEVRSYSLFFGKVYSFSYKQGQGRLMEWKHLDQINANVLFDNITLFTGLLGCVNTQVQT